MRAPFLENLMSLMVLIPHSWCLGTISSQSYLMMRLPSFVPAATMKPPSSKERQPRAVILEPTLQTSMSSWVARSYEQTIPLSPAIITVFSTWLRMVIALRGPTSLVIELTLLDLSLFELPAFSYISMTSPPRVSTSSFFWLKSMLTIL